MHESSYRYFFKDRLCWLKNRKNLLFELKLDQRTKVGYYRYFTWIINYIFHLIE